MSDEDNALESFCPSSIVEVFRKYGIHNDSVIGRGETKELLEEIEPATWGDKMIGKMYHALDIDHSGSINIKELVAFMGVYATDATSIEQLRAQDGPAIRKGEVRQADGFPTVAVYTGPTLQESSVFYQIPNGRTVEVVGAAIVIKGNCWLKVLCHRAKAFGDAKFIMGWVKERNITMRESAEEEKQEEKDEEEEKEEKEVEDGPAIRKGKAQQADGFPTVAVYTGRTLEEAGVSHQINNGTIVEVVGTVMVLNGKSYLKVISPLREADGDEKCITGWVKEHNIAMQEAASKQMVASDEAADGGRHGMRIGRHGSHEMHEHVSLSVEEPSSIVEALRKCDAEDTVPLRDEILKLLHKFDSEAWTSTMVDELYEAIDADHSGRIDIEAFMAYMGRNSAGASRAEDGPAVRKAEIKQADGFPATGMHTGSTLETSHAFWQIPNGTEVDILGAVIVLNGKSWLKIRVRKKIAKDSAEFIEGWVKERNVIIKEAVDEAVADLPEDPAMEEQWKEGSSDHLEERVEEAEHEGEVDGAAEMKVDPEELCKVFRKFDVDDTGSLSLEEFAVLMQHLDSDHWVGDKLADLLRAIDTNKNGCIEIDEFVAWLHDYDAESKMKLMEASASRLIEADFDPDSQWRSVDGLFDDSSNPRVTFREAVTAFPDDLQTAVQSDAWLAQKFAKRKKGQTLIEKYPGLSIDGAAAIFLYTCETPLYEFMNTKLRSKERNNPDFKAQFFPYIRMLVEALRTVAGEAPEKTVVTRGVPENLVKKYPDSFQEGETLILWAFTSCTRKVSAVKDFLGPRGGGTMFQIHTSKGSRIQEFSAVDSENEYLLPPGTALAIDGILEVGGNLTLVQCSDEADAPPLLK